MDVNDLSTVILGAILGSLIVFFFGRKFTSSVGVLSKEQAKIPLADVENFEDIILLLRSFKIDGEKSLTSRILNYTGNLDFTYEQEISFLLRQSGKLVAFGFPGEELPQDTGAFRVQCPNEGWQETIQSWMKRAHLIVVILGDTNGIRWELDAIDRNNLWLNTIILNRSKSNLYSILQEALETSQNMAISSQDIESCNGRFAAHFSRSGDILIFKGGHLGLLSKNSSMFDLCLSSWKKQMEM